MATTLTLGPADGTLTVRTERIGAAAKAGHDLLIEVDSWEATLELPGDNGSGELTLTADAGSLRVVQGTGGIQKLDDDDKAGIKQTLDEEILMASEVRFRSSSVEPSPDGGGIAVQGELELLGTEHPLAFDLALDGDRLTGSAVVKQSDWGIKPYTALFGALKVADEVVVGIDVTLKGEANG